MTTLLPCPFCGGEAAFAGITYGERTVREQEWGQSTFHYVNCIECGASNLGMVGHRTMQDAAGKWNRRAGRGEGDSQP